MGGQYVVQGIEYGTGCALPAVLTFWYQIFFYYLLGIKKEKF